MSVCLRVCEAAGLAPSTLASRVSSGSSVVVVVACASARGDRRRSRGGCADDGARTRGESERGARSGARGANATPPRTQALAVRSARRRRVTPIGFG